MSDLASSEAPPTAVLPADQPLTDTPQVSERRLAVRFTKENARFFAARAHAAHAAAKRKRLDDEARAKLEAEQKAAQDQPEANSELAIVWAECKRVNAALAGHLKPADRCALAKTLDMLLDRARIIRGLALPGTVSSRAPVAPASQASSMLGLTAPATSPEAARPTRDEQE